MARTTRLVWHPHQEPPMSIEPYSKPPTPIVAFFCAALFGMIVAALPQARAAESPYLLGDWNGSRSRLADQGITFDFGYTSEVAHIATGGTRQLTRHADQ